ncbi:2,3-dimethylmalate lyase [Cucumis melo var. makuwa]|uniref:2,3-dimethylmalate lyase n=1 Tax=Cucumis melo var. makuwa TaxID=1194695 RepID=A0A5A7TR78_CUCMM|nr:2,3-dimethylmalate lyase [Cucumis melo var. makuwa]
MAMSARINDESIVESPAKALRRILEMPGVHQGPACFDALSAKLVERAGFLYCFTSGFSISAARLALPDTGYISYGEMLDQGQLITQSVSIPVIGDGDNGYGNAMNVKRTVKGYIRAGFAGIILEDQVSPKACGHTQGRKVVSREEAVLRIKAAVDARKESGSDIVIVARTDSRQAVSLSESLRRARAFADAGADVLFIDALASKDEMEAFCKISPKVPKMANMLEGGGKTPILSPLELEEMGFKIVAYPLSLVGVSIRAMQDALLAIKGGRLPSPGTLPTFAEMKELLGFNSYYEEERKYASAVSQPSIKGFCRTSSLSNSENWKNKLLLPCPLLSTLTLIAVTSFGVVAVLCFLARGKTNQNLVEFLEKYSGEAVKEDERERVELEVPFTMEEICMMISGFDINYEHDLHVVMLSYYVNSHLYKLRNIVDITCLFWAGFLDGLTNIVPALGGVNIKELMDDAAGEVGGKQLLDFVDGMGDRIEVFLE